MPLIALLPCITCLTSLGGEKKNFSDEVYTGRFCSSCSKHCQWAHSHFRFESKDISIICNPLQETKATEFQKHLRLARTVKNEKQTVNKPVNTETNFRMQVSTFPLVLFNILTPVQQQSKMKCQNTYITLPLKEANRFRKPESVMP